jgi:diguanylate cyclase
MSPAKFIPLAEETGLIVEIGRWALRAACREAACWPNAMRVAVNISPVQLQLADVEAEIMDALFLAKLAPSKLDIEITEGVFVAGEAEIPATLSRIRRHGIAIALDDFGTGYSSLSYLARMPVDMIKIDQSFVRELGRSGEAEAIVEAILTLSQKLGKAVIAEGVETAEQAQLLARLGCPAVQGYHFGRPMDASALRALIAEEAVAPMQAKAG